MIKLTSFFPFLNFLRITHEFHDTKFNVKTKSLTFEKDEEYAYTKVAEISDSYQSSGSQMNFGSWLIIGIAAALLFFCNAIYGNIALLRSTQVLYICGLLLFVTGAIKNWHVFLSDKDDNVLATIKETRRNREAIAQVTEMIMSKSENIREITTTDPFPKTRQMFEHIYYDVANQNKTTDRFYANEIIGLEKSWYVEKAYYVDYKSLNGEILKGKAGIKAWEPILNIVILITSILFGLHKGFNVLPNAFITDTFLVLIAILLFSVFLIFIKQRVVGFFGKDGKIAYWAYISKTDEDKFQKIIEFVQSKVHAENKEATRKEQE